MADYVEKWELVIHEPLEGGSVSVVVGASRGDQKTVLKIHPPWLQRPSDLVSSAESEAAAFKIWNGEGAPKLLAYDTHALLLEHITPAEHSPDISAREAATLVSQIARPIDIREYPSLGIPFIHDELWKRRARAEASRHDAISTTLLIAATSLASYVTGFRALQRWELVHGDFKVKNILKRPDGSYAVIDPSPAIGSRLYDVALWAIDKPDTMLDRSAEAAEYLKVDPQVIGSLAVALAIPEICLASPKRAEDTLRRVHEITGATNLEEYFMYDFMDDDFMGGSYIVVKSPDAQHSGNS